MQITLEATGDRAQAALAPVQSFFEKEWGATAAPVPPSASPVTREDGMLAVATFILSLPPAILATLDLMEKARLRARCKSMLEDMRAVLRDCRGDVRLRIGGKVFDLRLASAEEVLDAIAEEEKKQR